MAARPPQAAALGEAVDGDRRPMGFSDIFLDIFGIFLGYICVFFFDFSGVELFSNNLEDAAATVLLWLCEL